ncbi:rhodanese-like domain-containing protein [Streptococcus caballi]|uniref:rhodanese-like domain-containing protein n=1 Tax=Streptococcus caballi TaxID=439220 RepID=UPI00037C6784|nr:rhodanese-like domain-containing protein [Streptococcus caballi]
MSVFTIILLIAALALLCWLVWNYYRARKAAKYIPNAEFEALLHTGQLFDVRDASSFHEKHILGARNFPAAQFEQSMSAIRKDKPVLLYDSSRGTAIPRIVILLKKAGYKDVYVLKDDFDYWTGKVK